MLIHQDHYEEVRAQLVEAVKGLKKGDPKDEDTFIGPLIAEKEAILIMTLGHRHTHFKTV